jgi:hypothetical protein
MAQMPLTNSPTPQFQTNLPSANSAQAQAMNQALQNARKAAGTKKKKKKVAGV